MDTQSYILKWNTPGTRGGPGGRDQTLAVKSRNIARKSAFVRDKKIELKKNDFFW